MIREDKFLISHAPYAVKLDSLKVTEYTRDSGTCYYGATVESVWFRRKSGVLTSHLGTLWDFQNERPADVAAFLQANDDGRYGGDCVARWDGESFWGNVSLDAQTRYLAVLRPMLESYPEVPPGFDGWWTFKGARS